MRGIRSKICEIDGPSEKNVKKSNSSIDIVDVLLCLHVKRLK